VFFFAALVITQQSSIFTGLMSRTFGFLTDVNQVDLWVMDPKVQFVDDTKPLQSTALAQVRGVDGVDWAVPMYRGNLRVRLPNGLYQSSVVVGLDDASLIGGPPVMVSGELSDLRKSDAIIVDESGAAKRLAKKMPTSTSPGVPLQVGDSVELNDRRALVVGIARITRTFQSQPVIYTTFTRASQFSPRERRFLTFVLVKVKNHSERNDVADRIFQQTGLAAYTTEEFKSLTLRYFLKNTGIPINFGIAVALGFVVGTAIVAQTFYSFVLENLRYLGILKAMGAREALLFRMTLLQSFVIGFLGCGMGVGVASLTRYLAQNSELAFRLPWQLLFFSTCSIVLIILLTNLFCIRQIIRLDPAIVFKGA
jgi:putative ABC transport system permease protein